MLFRRRKPAPPTRVACRIPAQGGWRLWYGVIIHEREDYLVVQEECYGVRRTVPRSNLISYIWDVQQHAPTFARAH